MTARNGQPPAPDAMGSPVDATAPHGRSPEDRNEAARAHYRQSITDGAPLTGAALGARFGRSERWGRRRIAEARSASSNPPGSDGRPPGTPPEPGAEGAPIAGDRSVGPTGPAPDGHRPQAVAGNGHGHPHPAGGDGHGHRPDTGTVAGHNVVTVGRDRHRAEEPITAPARPVAEMPRWARPVTVAAVVAVALAAAVASFEHLHEVAVMAGEGDRAALLPVSVDGLVTAATIVLYVASRTNRPPGGVAVAALVLGLAASLAGNIIAVNPDLVSPAVLKVAVAAWPPTALALALHVLLRQTDRH